MAEEEVMAEVEAVEAVYGDDCVVLERFPPHFHVHTKPRTADVSFQQFVEAVIEIQGGLKYPDEPPFITILDSKGLDEKCQAYLLSSVREKAYDLSSCLMLVALCEEAVERLSSMNQPDGNCPLCLYPLVGKDAAENLLPFVRLMSCFHCFHGECINAWWSWLEKMRQAGNTCSSRLADLAFSSNSLDHSSRRKEDREGMHKPIEEGWGECPVCRKIFRAKDIEHVLGLVGKSSPLSYSEWDIDEDSEKLLHSDSENSRRRQFDAISKLQQENNGLIEPKNHEVLLPGMFLRSTNPPPPDIDSSTKPPDQRSRNLAVTSSPKNRGGPSAQPSNNKHRSSGSRHRGYNSRMQTKQWIKKDKVLES